MSPWSAPARAGLAIGYFLARRGQRFVILDGADTHICSTWEKPGTSTTSNGPSPTTW
jgi:hypothetical protein